MKRENGERMREGKMIESRGSGGESERGEECRKSRRV
jgi:hypothetical protein